MGRGRARVPRVAGQAAGFVGSNAATSALGAVVTVLLTRNLTAAGFGSYAFAIAALAFLALFFEFGLFLPGARMAAKTDVLEGRRIVGASLVAFAPVGVAFSIAVFALSFAVDSWFHVHASDAVRAVAPLAFVYPFTLVLSQLAQGLDRLHVYSTSLVIGKVMFIVGAVLVLSISSTLKPTLAVVLDATSLLLAWLVAIAWLRPLFRGAVPMVSKLVRGARDYGFQVYLGRVMGTGTYNMDVLMVGALSTATAVGFYALAGSISYLIGLPAMGVAAALFPRMTRESRLDRKWLLGAWVVGLSVWLCAVALTRPVIGLVIGKRYLPAYPLTIVLGLAAIIRGVTSLYNSFLMAHARGRELRNAAVILTLSNLSLNFALIPPFGAMGAAWASVLALLANFAAHVLSYRRLREGETAEGTASSI